MILYYSIKLSNQLAKFLLPTLGDPYVYMAINGFKGNFSLIIGPASVARAPPRLCPVTYIGEFG
jgi:hypothetical protein